MGQAVMHDSCSRHVHCRMICHWGASSHASLMFLPCALQDNASSGAKFKQAREAERKSQAGNRAAWSTLFMRSDTVAEAVAAHYGISKSQLLSKDAADLPVRMALGEAHVIAMTKKALGDAGACSVCPLLFCFMLLRCAMSLQSGCRCMLFLSVHSFALCSFA